MLDICKKSWMKSQKLLDESILDATSKTWGIRAVAPRFAFTGWAESVSLCTVGVAEQAEGGGLWL